ncbi:DegT/DnrJ/EryC1/StrS family aminotransferase [uncultured Oscillibacter sp.]|uniref:DegT/DnrJ/EryC1/StrS family aminotransferase n=1 Tax=uncultured Oscillibacter sp. TaxID=876091 RepID=UPI003447F33F
MTQREGSVWLIEDNCDALGAEYYLDGVWRKTGTIGDIGTSSFYPAHHITMGEGGAIYTSNPLLHKIIRSLRDWGRDCVCSGGEDNKCGHRFTGQFGTLPVGYDHKYVYSHLGFNLKATDLQAAIGTAQLKKLSAFVSKRQENWTYLRMCLSPLERYLMLPESEPNTRPSWFGFLITVQEDSPVSRNELVSYLEEHNIQTRPLFAGNLTRHPCFQALERDVEYRVFGDLDVTDQVMSQSFWVGVYPGMEPAMLNEIAQRIKEKFSASTDQISVCRWAENFLSRGIQPKRIHGAGHLFAVCEAFEGNALLTVFASARNPAAFRQVWILPQKRFLAEYNRDP